MNAYKASIKSMSKNSFIETEQLKSARIIAESVLKGQQLMNTEEPIKIVSLANQYGFTVIVSNRLGKFQGVISYDESGKTKQLGTNFTKVIAVSEDLTLKEKRFVTAHELGHYIMEGRGITERSYGDTKQGFQTRGAEHGRSDYENTVDYFAACLLMPSQAVWEVLNRPDTKAKTKDEQARILSEIFQVDIEVAERRIVEVESTGK